MNDLLIFNHIEMILAGMTAGLFIIQLLYYLVTYARPLRQAKRRQMQQGQAKPAVSVIVYAKNETPSGFVEPGLSGIRNSCCQRRFHR